MKLRMLTSMEGPTVSRAVGDIVEVPDDEAERIVDAGFAELAPDDAPSRRGGREKAVAAGASENTKG